MIDQKKRYFLTDYRISRGKTRQNVSRGDELVIVKEYGRCTMVEIRGKFRLLIANEWLLMCTAKHSLRLYSYI